MLSWVEPNGTSTIVDRMEVPGYTSRGSTTGKVQGPSQQGGDPTTRWVAVGGVERPVLVGGIHIPIGTTLEVDEGWECTVTKVGESDDPTLLGNRYRVIAAPSKSFATARRLDVVQL
jgi:hypothetical protein